MNIGWETESSIINKKRSFPTPNSLSSLLMEDVKDKMKGLMKKVNNTLSSSPSAFKGQARVLGSTPTSSSSIPPNPNPSRLLPPSQPPLPANRPVPANPDAFDTLNPLIASAAKRSEFAAAVECPICSSPFPSEEAVSAHIDSCLGSDSTVNSRVGEFLSAEPDEGSVDVIIKLLRNVAREPENDKFRRIRLGNPRIKEAIVDVRGGLELLECVGFGIRKEDGEKWATMEEPTRKRLAAIGEAVSLMERWKGKDAAVAVNVTLRGSDVETHSVPPPPRKVERKVRVFFSVPESVAAKIVLPDSFYNLSTEELRREAEARKKKIADSQLLIPRSYKEKQAMAARKKYKLAVIRIQFPDGVVLQGVFSSRERTTALYEFVSSSIKEAILDFELLSPAVPRVHVIPRFAGADGKTPTLEEENLVPSALVKFKPVETDSIVFTGLANELLELIEPLTASTTVL